ncbi:MAG: lactonase family protein [Victivallales bacterium]|nr:lactonase family protein [Victivallales bacterium]
MKSKTFYIASCAPEGGIHSYVYEDNHVVETGFFPVANANYIAFSPDKRFLFTSIAAKGIGGIASFKINADDSLEKLCEVVAPEMQACHLCCNPEATHIFTANYPLGRLAQYPLHDGIVGEVEFFVQHPGHGPRADRQENAHAHYTIISPEQKYLCVVDLGVDAIFAYPLTADGIDRDGVKCSKIVPGGSGPRHLVFTQDGKRAYLLNELASTVTSLTYEDGLFSIVQTVPMLPEPYKDFNGAAAIRLTADEKFLLASNRGYDSIVTYRVFDGGILGQSDLTLCAGSFPRDFNFLPSCGKFAIGHEKSNHVYFYGFDPISGRLTPDGNIVRDIPRPICIVERV